MTQLQLVLVLLPQIISFIKAAESAFPNAGAGPSKLNAVLDSVSAVVGAVPEVAEHALSIKTTLAPVVSSLVGAFNSLGLFKRSG